MYNNNFDDIKNLVEEMVDGFNLLKDEWKMKNDDEKEEIVESIYQTKVNRRRRAMSFPVAEKAEIRYKLEEMFK